MKDIKHALIYYGFPLSIITVISGIFVSHELNFVMILIGGMSGAFFGTIFGMVFLSLVKKTGKKWYDKIGVSLDEDEKAVMIGPGNHFIGKEAVGGKLVLTNRRLIFKSHKMNFNNHGIAFPLSDIKELSENRKKILNVQFNLNGKHKFTVDSAKEWITAIQKTK